MFLVLEMQTNDNDEIATLSYQYETREAAESKFYSVLSAACVSQLKYHACFIISHVGEVLERQSFYHGEVPQYSGPSIPA